MCGSLEHACAGRQFRLALDHARGVAIRQRGLLGLGGNEVDLCPDLAVAEEHLQGNASGERSLAIAAGHVDEYLAVAARAILALPAERAGDDGLLPWFQLEWLTGAGAFHVLQALREEV